MVGKNPNRRRCRARRQAGHANGNVEVERRVEHRQVEKGLASRGRQPPGAPPE